MVGNPTPFPTCSVEQLVGAANGNNQQCPVASQVGKVVIKLRDGSFEIPLGIFNLEHGPEVPARFGFNYLGYIATITPRIRPDGYAISAGSFEIGNGLPVAGARLTFWGFPADSKHDLERQGVGNPQIEGFFAYESNADKVPFFTNPTACPDSAATFTARGDSWEDPAAVDTRLLPTDEEGNPFVWEGCENLTFEPTMTPVPGTHRAHSPTGLDVNIDLPSNDGS